MSGRSSIVKRVPRPDRSRSALIDAAARLFRRQGYAATGVNQILQEANVKAGSLYHHFPDGKAALAVAVVESVGGDIERLLRTFLAGDTAPADVVDRWIDMLADGLDRDVRDGCPIEPIATESVHADAAMRSASGRAFEGWCAAIAERLTADGWSAHAADRTGRAVIALIEGALIVSRTSGSRATLDAAAGATRTLLDGPHD